MADEVKVESKSVEVEVPAEIKAFREKQAKFAVKANEAPPPILDGKKEHYPNEGHEEAGKESESDNEEDVSDTHESEPENDSPPKAEKDSKLDKRYKDLQSVYTKSNQKIKHLERLINKFDKYIKRDENGEALDWDFTEIENVEKTKKEVEEIPPEPTEEDWDLTPKKATEMALKREKYLWKKELKEERDIEKSKQEAYFQANKEKRDFDIAWNESLEKAESEYSHADFKNLESPIQKKMLELVNEDPSLVQHPNANLIVARMAAAELGIMPKSKEKVKINQKNEIGRTKFLTGNPGSGSSANSNPLPSDTKFSKYLENKEKFKAKGHIHII